MFIKKRCVVVKAPCSHSIRMLTIHLTVNAAINVTENALMLMFLASRRSVKRFHSMGSVLGIKKSGAVAVAAVGLAESGPSDHVVFESDIFFPIRKSIRLRGCSSRWPGGHIFLKGRGYERIQQIPAHLYSCLEIRMQDKIKTWRQIITFETLEQFTYLGRTITNGNPINEEIKSRLKPGNACHHSVQTVLSSSLLSKDIKIKV